MSTATGADAPPRPQGGGDDGAIAAAFREAKSKRRSLFIPFLMAGDPDLETTDRLLDALAAGGADLIELGMPFSDPIADGPVIQRAAFRSLNAGTTLTRVLDLIARFRSRSPVPVLLFTYYNPIHARGVESFAEQAAASAVDGVLCVDLPAEEGVEELGPALEQRGIDLVYLLAPTSTRERVKRVASASRGFVYYVSRTGVTGERGSLPSELVREVKRLRRRVRLPVAVGFGISSPEQVASVAKVAEGVVVGSALVRLVEQESANPDLPAVLERRVRELVAPLRGRRR